MDLKFILNQLRDQHQSLDSTIHALEDLIRERDSNTSSEAIVPDPAESPTERPRSLICRWCQRSFTSEQWSPVCKSPDCRAKESALKEARKSGRASQGKRSGAGDAH